MKQLRTVAVITAHDEGRSIGDTVRGIAKQAEAVWVIADNCADDTVLQAMEAGARVLERDDPTRLGKGPALTWLVEFAFDDLIEFDSVVVLDADSAVNDCFIASLQACIGEGAAAAQASVCPIGGAQSSASALAAYSELLSQKIGDRIRSRLGWSVPLRGTGMAFRPDVLRDTVSGVSTRVEDVEMSLRLARRGIRVHHVPQAVVYDPKPASTSRVSRQRARWLQGQMQVWRTHGLEIVPLALTGGPAAWALLWALLAKPKTLLMAAKALVLLAMVLLPFGPAWLRMALAGATGFGLAVDVVYYLMGLAVVEDWRLYGRALLVSPLFLIVWLWSAGLGLVSSETWFRARD